MTDHMKEAERLMRHYTTAVLEQNYEAIALYHFTLLAHIQRGAAPMKLNAGFYTLVAEKPFAEHGHPEWRHMYRIIADDNGRVLGYISDPSMLAAAPAPDHFRDAANMVTAPAELPESAERAMVKVIDTSADVVCASDEWNKENDANFKRLLKRSKDAQAELRATVQQYGVACRAAGEAAGYARGRAEAGRDAAADGNERAEWEGAVFTLMGHAAGLYANGQNDMPNWIYELAEKIARQHADEALAARVREVGIQQRAELAAALRGEVKP